MKIHVYSSLANMPSLWKVAGAWCTNKIATDLKEQKKERREKNKEKKTFANGGSLVSDLARRLFFFYYYYYYSSPPPLLIFFLFVCFFFFFNIFSSTSKHWPPQRFFHRFLCALFLSRFLRHSNHRTEFSSALLFNHLSFLFGRDRASQ